MSPTSLILEDAARVLTWVRVAGYALEKIHTGVLVHALSSGRPAACALAASLWNQVTSASLAPENISELRAAPEVSLGDGADSVIDLLLSFHAGGQPHLLGLEMKVDASPRKEQLERLRDGVRAKSPAAHGMALVALGSAEVCRIERGVPDGVKRLGVGDLHARADLLREAGDPAIVDPWLQELAFEVARRNHADEVTEGTDARFGYRSRTLRTYQYALLSQRLVGLGGKPWEVSIQSHNVIATAADSWRDLPGGGAPTKLYLELTDDAICLKAGCWTGRGDPRKESAGIIERVFAGFRAAGLTVERPTQRRGTSATLCKIPRKAGEDLAPQLLAASRAWTKIWDDIASARQRGQGAPISPGPSRLATIKGVELPPEQAVRALEPVEVLLDIDGPRLFTARSSRGDALLAFHADETDTGTVYIVVPTDASTLDQLRTGALPLRDALGQHRVWIVTQAVTGEVLQTTQVAFEDIPHNCLPATGEPIPRSSAPLNRELTPQREYDDPAHAAEPTRGAQDR